MLKGGFRPYLLTETPVYNKKWIFIDILFDKEFEEDILKKLKEKYENRLEIDIIAEFNKGKGAIKLDDEILRL